MSTVEKQNSGAISKRLAVVKQNMSDLSPIGEQLKQNALEFNRQRAVAGVDKNGNAYAPLKQSTLEHRDGSGPPLAPEGASSGIVTQCQVTVEYAAGSVTVSKSWPSLKWIKYAIAGNAHTPPRDPTGFSKEEKQVLGDIVTKHVTKKS